MVGEVGEGVVSTVNVSLCLKVVLRLLCKSVFIHPLQPCGKEIVMMNERGVPSIAKAILLRTTCAVVVMAIRYL